VLRPAPSGLLMVRYFSPLTKHSNIGDVRKMIHEGKVFELGCLMLAKHHLEIILDDGKLDDVRFDYLVVGVAKIRVRVNSSSDKSDIWTKTSYPNPIWITNRTF